MSTMSYLRAERRERSGRGAGVVDFVEDEEL